MAIIKNNLKAYYNSKEGVSTSTWSNIATKTIGNYDAVIYGATLQPNGVSLDGVDDYVTINPSETEIKDFTINFMLKSNTSNFESSIDLSLYVEGFGDGAGYTVGTIGVIGGNVYLRNNGDKLLGLATNNVGFSLRYTASTGVLEHIFPDGSIVVGTTAQLRVNAISYKSKSFLNVVRYYDKALTNQEIQQNYAEGTKIGLSITKELFTNGVRTTDIHSNYGGLFMSGNTENRFELLITKNDLIGAGFQEFDVIKDLRFFNSGIPGVDLTNVKMGIKHTTKTNTINGVFDAYSTFTEVFNQPTILKSSITLDAWFPLIFSNTFTWNGVDNILVTVLRDMSVTDFSGYWDVRTLTDIERYKQFDNNTGTSPYDTEIGQIITNEPSPKTAPATQLTVADRVSNLHTASAIITSTTTNEDTMPINTSIYTKAIISSTATISSMPIREFFDGTDTIVKAGLIGYWNAKQGISSTQWDNIAPDTLGNYNGAVTGAISTVNGIYFDGIDDYIMIPAISNIHLPTHNITVETWVKIEASTFTEQYVIATDFYASLLHKNEKFASRTSLGVFYNNLAAPHNNYHHVVYRIDVARKKVTVTVNGVSEDVATNLDLASSTSYRWYGKNIFVSQHTTSTADYYKWRGHMPLMRIYNRVLNDDEIIKNANTGYEIALEPPATTGLPKITSAITNKYKISDETGMNQSTITVQFDTAVTQYVARLNGTDYNTGTLIHSGGAVAANTDAQVIIDWTELLAEGANRINIYGQNEAGWTSYVDSAITVNNNKLIGYWNSKQGVNLDVWSNISPNTIGLYDGTITGATVQANGMTFDGIDDNIIMTIPEELKDSTPLTIEFRFNISNAAAATIISTSGEFIFVQNTKKLHFWMYSKSTTNWSQIISNTTFQNNQDYYISLCYTPTTGNMKIYVNGVLDKETTGNYTDLLLGKTGTTLRIGSSGTAHPNGIVDGVRIYNRVLTAAEILNNYNIRKEL